MGETLYEYYLRFSQLINEVRTIGMTMQQVQVNTMFQNALSSEWSKFVTDVKLAKTLYTNNYDQLYAYLSQHERHDNVVRITHERYLDPLELVANSPTLYNPSQSPQYSGSSMYPPHQELPPVYPTPIHHQYHHTLINPQQHLVSPQPFISPSVTQHSQDDFPQLDSSLVVPTFQQGKDPIECINKAMAFLSVVASRTRNAAWFKEKLMLAEAQKAGQILDDAQLELFVDSRILEAPVAKQTEDLDAYDSDCDDLSSAKAVLMAKFSNCDSDVLFEESQDAVIQDTNSSAPNDLLVLSSVEQMTDHVAYLDKKIKQIKWASLVKESLKKLKYQLVSFEKVVKVRTTSDAITAALKNELRKLKGKNVVDIAVSKPNATIAPRMFKLDIEPISHRLNNNRDAHEFYHEKTIENTNTLRGLE
nr:hypothetical protein [Tanacetum cinerariifolium]